MAMIHILPIFSPVILVGVGILAVFIIALAKAGAVGRWIFVGVGLFLLLLIMPVFTQRTARIKHAVEPTVDVFKVPSQISLEDNAFWQENLEKEFMPDTYSSLRAAAYGLGMQLYETIQEALGQSPSEIVILETSSLTKSDLNEFQNGLKSRYDQADIYFKQHPMVNFPEGTIYVEVSVLEEKESKDSSAQDSSLPASAGRLEAVVETRKGKYYKSVSYDYRSWLWDTHAFVANASNKNWMVSVSDETAISREEARGQALDKAVETLSKQIWNTNSASKRSVLITRQDLLQRDFIRDEYSQKLIGMAGPIWRYAVLLEVSPEDLHSLVTASAQEIQIQHNTKLRSMFSLGGMLLLICVVYIFANAATKGYYSTVLTITAVLAAVILGFMILNRV